MIYLDNNATTFMSKSTIAAMNSAANLGNASSGYQSAMKARSLLDGLRSGVAKCSGISLDEWYILITSGASESNCTILNMIINAAHAKQTMPTVVTSQTEHKTTLQWLSDAQRQNRTRAVYVGPNRLGILRPEDFRAHIRPETSLVSIIACNNETGAITNIAEIGAMCRRAGVPLYVDATQSYGKWPLKPDRYSVDAFGFSFHKMYGPPGCGILAIRKSLVERLDLTPMIAGSQNFGLRGGTENLPGVAASLSALSEAMSGRVRKNTEMYKNKQYVMQELAKCVPCTSLSAFYTREGLAIAKRELEVVFISGQEECWAPNTLLLTVVKRTEPYICNVRMKQLLERRKIIVSIGSACNTASEHASHVIQAMKMPPLMRKGVLRISLGDHNTRDEMKKLIIALVEVLRECTTSEKCKK